MRFHNFLIVFFGLLSCTSCKKTQSGIDENACFNDAEATRQITNSPAAIFQLPDSSFVLVEEGTFDTWLIPCNLPSEFEENNLLVVLSGKTRPQVSTVPAPCCPEEMIVTQIARR